MSSQKILYSPDNRDWDIQNMLSSINFQIILRNNKPIKSPLEVQ